VEGGPRLEVDYQLEFDEFYRVLRWHTLRRDWWVYVTLTVLFAAALINTLIRPIDESPSKHLIDNLPGLTIPLFLAGLSFWIIYRNARRQFKTNNSLGVVRHYIFSTGGLEYSSSASAVKSSWTALHKVVETPEFFLFFSSNASFGVFPKRCLESDARTQALRDLIREQAGSKAMLRKS
jgi:YcxB-like protein